MADQFLGEIRAFGFPFAPLGWALCQGQTLPIQQNTALFALLGTTYGGDGIRTFGLPNLAARLANGPGQGLGLQNYNLGATGGSTSVTLLPQQVPQHTHTLPVSSSNGKQPSPSPGTFLGATGSRGEGTDVYCTPEQQSAAPATMLATAVGPAGGNQPHNNLGPYVVLNFCIALQGTFPQRP